MSELKYHDVPSVPGRAINVTPSDATTYPNALVLWVIADGNIVVDPANGGDTITAPVVAGQIVPFTVRRVLAATTATVVGIS